MATNPLIPLQARVPQTDPFGSFLRGVDYKDSREDRARAKELQPMEDRLLKLKEDAARQDLETGAIKLDAAQGQLSQQDALQAYSHANNLMSIKDPLERARVHAEFEARLGIDDGVPDDLSDEALSTTIRALQPIAQAAQPQIDPTSEMRNALFAANGDQALAQQIVAQGLTVPIQKMQLDRDQFALDLQEFQAKQSENGEVDFDDVQKLRKEFVSTTAQYSDRVSAINTLISAAQDTSGASDVALITAFMKVLDPGSVVREGEFANVAKAQGLGDRLISIAESVDKGRIISDAMRTDLLQSGRSIFQAAKGQYEADKGTYTNIAEANGFPVEQVVIDRGDLLPDPTPRAATTVTPAEARAELARRRAAQQGTGTP